MGHLLSYTLYSSLFLLASYLIYKIMLAGEKQTEVNRVIIFGLYAASFIAPALLAHGDDIAAKAVDTIAAVDFGEPEVMHIGTASSDLFTALILAYIAGMAVTAILTLVSAVNIFIIISRGDKTPRAGYTLVSVDDGKTAPFSWGRYIVASRSDIAEAGDMIIAHELGHIRGRHWLDLVFARIVCVIEWYNPAAWLMFDELKDVHEYAADEYVLVHGFNARQYQMLLIKKAAGTRFQALANSFNHSKLKKRITMMYSQKSQGVRRYRALALIPALALAATIGQLPAVASVVNSIGAASAGQLFAASPAGAMTAVNAPGDSEVTKNNQPEQIATYPGGEAAMYQYLAQSVKYPEEAAKNDIQGRVTVRFTVKTDGSLTDLAVVKGVDPALDKEAIRVISGMPRWNPATVGGKAVESTYTIPVSFKLSGGKAAKNGESNRKVTGDDTLAEFPGGTAAMYQYLTENVKYPEEAARNNSQGRVTVRFTVKADGSLTDFSVVNGVAPALDKEAVRVISSMPRWNPATVSGKAVESTYTIPVSFKLSGDDNAKK